VFISEPKGSEKNSFIFTEEKERDPLPSRRKMISTVTGSSIWGE
jgi:hypothetical protein